MLKKNARCTFTLGHSVKDRLVKAAFDLMAEKGVENVSVREIVAKVKVTKPVLYYYFKNKEDLCRHIFTRNMERFKEMLDEAGRNGGDLLTLMETIFTMHYCIVTARPKIARMMMHSMSSNERKSQFAVMMEELRLFNRTLLKAAITQALKKDGLPESCMNDVLHAIGCFMAHVLMTTIVEPESFSGDEEFPHRMAVMFSEGIKAAYKPA